MEDAVVWVDMEVGGTVVTAAMAEDTVGKVASVAPSVAVEVAEEGMSVEAEVLLAAETVREVWGTEEEVETDLTLWTWRGWRRGLGNSWRTR